MKITRKGGTVIALLATGAIAFGLSACGSSNNSAASSDTSGGASSAGGKIALLLPETQNARYETKDRPLFTAKVKELCPNCEVLYSNADQDAAKQQQQAEAALTNGAKVLVLDAVDAASTGAIVAQANAKGVPVFAYDRAIPGKGVAYYNSYDNAKVGELQGNALLDKLKADGKGNGTIVMINGSPTDNNAKLFKKGAHSVFDSSTLKIGAEYDAPNWLPAEAQTFMDQAITKLGKNGFVGVYSANDGLAGGIIAAMKAAGIDPSTRPTTGPGRRAGRNPADPRRRAVHDGLQGHQAAGRGRRDHRGGARAGQAGERRDDAGEQRHRGRSEHHLRPRLGDEGQREGHDRGGRVLDPRRDLHRPLQGRLHGRRHPVASTAGPGRGSSRPGGPVERTSMTVPVLDLKGVSKRFGAVEALTDVDFRVDAGEVVALVGDNGAGKSTLIKAVSGVGLADSGEFRFLGEPASISGPQDATALGIATVYQDLALADNLDVSENLYLGQESYLPGPLRWLWMLDDLGMEKESGELIRSLSSRIPNVTTQVASLSGGQRQIVAIARSLLGDPKLVMLDEPTAALGVAQTAQVLDLILKLKERGLGVVVISHNLTDVFAVADRIVVLFLGRNAGEFKRTETTREEVVGAITSGPGTPAGVGGDEDGGEAVPA